MEGSYWWRLCLLRCARHRISILDQVRQDHTVAAVRPLQHTCDCDSHSRTLAMVHHLFEISNHEAD